MPDRNFSQFNQVTPVRDDIVPYWDTSASAAARTTLSSFLTGATRIVAPAGYQGYADYYTDGTADDVQIQQACTDVNSLGGGTVLIRAGTYNIAATVLYSSGTMIIGEGLKTILKPITNLNAAVLKSNGRINSSTVRDLKVDGNKANQSTSGTGIEVDGYFNHFENLWVIDCKTYGLYLSATVASSENIVDGGRYNANTYGIYINSGNADNIVRNVTAYGGNTAIYNKAGGGRFEDIISYGSTAQSLYTSVQCDIHNFRTGTVPIGIYIDGSSNNIFGIWSGVTMSNVSFTEVTDHCVYINSGSSYSALVSVLGWYGNNSTNADLSLDGAGTHKLKIITNYTTIRSELLSTGTIHAESVIKQPEFPRSSTPTSPIKGMIYLDSGTNTLSTKYGYRYYNGSSWVDIAG